MERQKLLVAEGITKRFTGLTAVNRMDLTVYEGERHAIIGPNGSGKTTFINVITGFYYPEEGRIIFDGAEITAMKAHVRTRNGIARTFQNIRLFDDMSVYENIALGMHVNSSYNFIESMIRAGRFRKQEKAIREVVEEVAETLRITGLLRQSISNLPYGKRKIVEIARALAAKPKLILLDEPAAGMNDMEVIELASIIRHISDLKITVLLVEHNMDFIKDISNTVSVMDSGLKIAEGCFKEISSDPRVIEAYLGKGVKKNVED